MALLVTINNFLHDFSAAWWIVSSLMMWYLLRLPDSSGRGAKAAMAALLVRTMPVSLVGIVLFGALRLWSYKTYEWVDAAGSGQVRILAAKHAFFAVILVLGIAQWLKGRSYVARGS